MESFAFTYHASSATSTGQARQRRLSNPTFPIARLPCSSQTNLRAFGGATLQRQARAIAALITRPWPSQPTTPTLRRLLLTRLSTCPLSSSRAIPPRPPPGLTPPTAPEHISRGTRDRVTFVDTRKPPATSRVRRPVSCVYATTRSVPLSNLLPSGGDPTSRTVTRIKMGSSSIPPATVSTLVRLGMAALGAWTSNQI